MSVAASSRASAASGSRRGGAAVLLPTGRRKASTAPSVSVADDNASVADTLLPDGQGLDLEGDDAASRTAAAQRCLAEGKTALDKVLELFGADQHLEHSRQQKAVSAGVDRLRKWARKLAKFANDPECTNFSQQLFDAADEVEERQQLFDDARNRFVALVSQAPSNPREIIIKTLAVDTICSLVSKEAPRISDGALCNQMDGMALFTSLIGPGGPVKPQGIGLHLVRSDSALVRQCQKPIVHSQLEAIFKQPSFNAMAEASDNFLEASWFSSLDSEAMMTIWRQVPATAASQSESSMLYGWEPGLLADMLCTHIMAQVSKCLSVGKRIPGNLHGIIKEIVATRGKLAGRVRSFHKHIGGVSHCARDAWRAMEKLSEDNVAECGVSVDEVTGWTKNLRDARNVSAADAEKREEVLIALAELCDGSESKLKSLAAWMVYCQNAGCADNK